MNLRHWQLFLRICDSGGLSRATAVTGVGQPALSRLVRDLEAEFGVRLFERHARGLRLTPAGERFRRRAMSVLDQVFATGADLRAAPGELDGECRIALPPSLTTLLTVPTVAGYRLAHPAVRLTVMQTSVSAIRDRIADRAVDFGVIVFPTSDPRLVSEPLGGESLYVVGPPGGRIATGESIPVDRIADLPLVLPDRSNSVRVVIDFALERAGRNVRPALETDGQVGEYVRAGCGYAVTTGSALGVAGYGLGLPHARLEGVAVTWAVARREEPLSRAAAQLFEDMRLQAGRVVAAGRWAPPRPAAVQADPA